MNQKPKIKGISEAIVRPCLIQVNGIAKNIAISLNPITGLDSQLPRKHLGLNRFYIALGHWSLRQFSGIILAYGRIMLEHQFPDVHES